MNVRREAVAALSFLEAHRAEMVDDLRAFVERESPSGDADRLNEFARFLASYAQDAGGAAEVVEAPDGNRHVRVEWGKSSDEEIGSGTSRELIEAEARQASAVLVLEPSQGGALKTARKGVGNFRVIVTGRAAHAGLDPGAGISAIEELAHLILDLHHLSDPTIGSTVNVGVIGGGTRPNVVAAEATAEVDIRFSSQEEGDRLTDAILHMLQIATRPAVPVPTEIGNHCYSVRMRRVPFTGSEKESLHASLDRHRDVVVWKLEGLDDVQLRRPMTPSGTNLLGLVKHLAWVEYGWFCETFGRQSEAFAFDPDDPEADMRAEPHETTADIVAFYGRARSAADRAIEELALGETGTSWSGNTVSMRWVLIHMIEETARHAGHMDILRELIDGQTGDHPDR